MITNPKPNIQNSIQFQTNSTKKNASFKNLGIWVFEKIFCSCT